MINWWPLAEGSFMNGLVDPTLFLTFGDAVSRINWWLLAEGSFMNGLVEPAL